jgi:glycosyltransferase involved in cell wall biosynthesis
MKVLWVLSELRASGSEVMAAVAAEQWRQASVKLEVLSTGSSIGSYAEELRQCGYQIHHLPLEPFRDFALAYIKLLRRGRYDVVHIHQERANFYLALLAKLSGIGSIVRSINSQFHFAGFARIERIFQRWILRLLAVKHVSIGRSVMENELSSYRNPSTLVHCWYDAASFSPSKASLRAVQREALGLNIEQFAVATVGNCAQVKNHAVVIRALVDLHPSVVYLHAGTEDIERSERQLADDLGVIDRVKFLGHVSDVAGLLHGVDCFIMPSRLEGLGVAALEALGSGVPAILADVDGLRDLKPYFPDVMWVDPHTPEIVKAITQMIPQAAVYRDVLASTVARRAKDYFGPARLVPELIAVYRD